MGLRDKYPGMSILWQKARHAISQATRIVFVGYRFPPTDANARVEILTKIKVAHDSKTLTRVQIVLGPDEHDPHVVRMKKLLGVVCPDIPVDVVPLYAEDLLAMPKEWVDPTKDWTTQTDS
jgi:hypothetical protein